MNKITTYNERTLHAALKRYFEPDTECHEVKYKGYVCDVKSGSGIVEIQTGSFYKLKAKLTAFLEEDNVTVVYPCVRTKWVVWVDPESGEVSSKRKSPRKGSIYSILPELYGIAELFGNERLTVKLVEVDVEEYKRLDGWSKDRKKGATKVERVPVDIGETYTFALADDCRVLIPDTLPDSFSSAEFSKAVKLGGTSLWRGMKFLCGIGLLECDDSARKYIYRRTYQSEQ